MQAQYYTSKLSEVENIKAFDEFCHPDIKVKNNTNSFENNHLVCSLDLPLDPAKEEEGESTLSKVWGQPWPMPGDVAKSTPFTLNLFTLLAADTITPVLAYVVYLCQLIYIQIEMFDVLNHNLWTYFWEKLSANFKLVTENLLPLMRNHLRNDWQQ